VTAAARAQSRAWGWVAHLTSGGTTAWADWSGDAPPAGVVLPGAQHLELLRRLNQAGPAPAPLVDRILHSGAPGRGQQELELVGVAEPTRYGAPPVDPSALPDDELVRLASGVLADLVVSAPEPTPPRLRRPRLLRREYRLVGNRLTADYLRAALIRDGRPPGGPRALVLVLAGDLGALLADTWAARVRRGFAPAWDGWVHRLAERRTLPSGMNPLTQARAWADRVGPDRVHLVFDIEAAGPLLGVRGPAARALTAPPRLSHAALDAAGHTKGVLRVLVNDAEREQRLRGVLLPWLEAGDSPTLPGPVVPRRYRGWLESEARRIRAGLETAGYAVHGGELDQLMPAEPVRTAGPSDGEILTVMLRTLRHAAGVATMEGNG